MYRNDIHQLNAGMLLYDAFYRWRVMQQMNNMIHSLKTKKEGN